MMNFVKPLAVLGVAGAMALAAATPSEARNGRNAAAIGAGVAGFAIGAGVAAAAANNNYYYGRPAYGYYGGPAYVDSYAYSPAPTYYHGPSGYYAPNYEYQGYYRHNGPNREDQLTGSGAGFIH